jgi:hypothetical protein
VKGEQAMMQQNRAMDLLKEQIHHETAPLRQQREEEEEEEEAKK